MATQSPISDWKPTPSIESEKLTGVTDQMVADFERLFVNRRAFMRQNALGQGYSLQKKYQSKETIDLQPFHIRRHLQGDITISLYAINPADQCCKWIAIDADYDRDLAVAHLLKMKDDLLSEGVHALIEHSRRGAHLWIFGAEPLPARECRLYAYNLAISLGVPVKTYRRPVPGEPEKDGIEIFPRQNGIEPDQFGNGVRAPFGIHLKSGKRYWFNEAAPNLEAQFALLRKTPKITKERLMILARGLTMPDFVEPPPEEEQSAPPPSYIFRPSASGERRRWIRDFLGAKKFTSGHNDFFRCPSCALKGHDRHGDNLAVSNKHGEENYFKCWRNPGCDKDEIWESLGFPRSTFDPNKYRNRQQGVNKNG